MGVVVVTALIESIEDLYRVQRGQLPDADVRRITADEALVDTGATGLALPRPMIDALGLMPIRARRMMTPSGVRDIPAFGAVRLTIGGRECVCDVIELANECPVLIGQVSLELMDFVVDPGRRKLIGNPAHNGEHLLELM